MIASNPMALPLEAGNQDVATRRMVFAILVCAFMFESVLVIPLDQIREGVRLQWGHIIVAVGDVVFLLAYLARLRLPTVDRYQGGVLLLYLYGLYIAMAQGGASYALFVFALFFGSLLLYITCLQKVVFSDSAILTSPLRGMTVLFLVVFVDWFFRLFDLPLLPTDIDFRQHEFFRGWPRFEGYQPLSLGAAYWLVVYFLISYVRRSTFAVMFSLLLLLVTFSTGVFVACAACAAVYLFVSTKKRWLRVLVCGLCLAGVLGTVLVASSVKSGTFSAAERLSFWLYLPTFLSEHPSGIGLGGSRYLTDLFDVPMLTGGTVDHSISESSFLDLAYEFGVAGVAFFFWLAITTVRLVPYAIKVGGAAFIIVFTNLFVVIHSFFNPSYFTQPRYLLMLLMLLSLRARQRAGELDRIWVPAARAVAVSVPSR